MSSRVWLIAGFVALVCSIASGQRGESSLGAFMDWAQEAAIPVDLSRGIAPEVLEPLLDGKRVVFLGEPHHFIQEKYTFRMAFLRPLHELGWRHLGAEIGRSSGLRIDTFLQNGERADLLDVGFYSNLASISSNSEPGSFLEQEFMYAESLRRMGEGSARWHYFGFDIDKFPGDGIEDARFRLRGLRDNSELRLAIDQAWSSWNTIDELAALIEMLGGEEDALARELPLDRRRELRLDLLGLKESLAFAATLHSGEEWQQGFRRRESFMCLAVDAYAQELVQDDCVVLTGHSLHLGKTWKGLRWNGLTVGLLKAPIDSWPTVGSHIYENDPSKLLSIWMMFDRSKETATNAVPKTRGLPSIPQTVECQLAKLPFEAFLLPLADDDPRSRWLNEERTFRVNDEIGWGRLRDLTDVLLFVREVTLLPAVTPPEQGIDRLPQLANPKPEMCEIRMGGKRVHLEYLSLCEDPSSGEYVLCVGGPEAFRTSGNSLACDFRGETYYFNGWHHVEGDEWGHAMLSIPDPKKAKAIGRLLGVRPVEFAPDTRLEHDFHLARDSYDRDEDVWVVLTVRNTSDQAMHFYKHDPPPKGERNESFSFKVSHDGEHGRWQSERSERTIRSSHRVIEPGEKFVDRELLSKWADTTKPGEYTVDVSYGFELLAESVKVPDGACPVPQAEFPLTGTLRFTRR